MFDHPPKSSFVMESDTYDALHLFAAKRVGSADAADLVHEAYLRFLQMDDRHNVREPRAFLFRIVANLGIDLWRKDKRRLGDGGEVEAIELETLHCPMPGPEDTADGMQRFDRFLSVLDELPDLQRHAFILNKLEGMDHQQIAEQLGVCTKSVRRYLIQAMAHVADRLDGEVG